ncbi:uncharacterized protein MONBRDRAFT_33739 [Monosiga brevicollis MX1]|uniref:Store-operated calcium entry-associated regulatory factor n=1 Tax=Monosiga brevicollis TaxID=81824 RepID=A9V768_MONBE|nr:uncharacterized protein MONBRDRAFT_33739 [Monosiga brevicollis MX1]EDQ86738.1 predicted protein [Monosiga brevicollis MX1]|eukprot:XP_001748574.1 hypothetical protein [Monosiga brevicollis MX1]
MTPRALPLLLLVGVAVAVVAGFSSGGKDRVLLDQVKVLTLKAGAMTTGRRSSPVPQLKCVGGSAGCRDAPERVQCINQGSDGYDIQWECKADLPARVRFGSVEVVCEGYSYADDPYILAGSCGLEYSLESTGAGQSDGYDRRYSRSYEARHESGGGLGSLLSMIVMGALVFFALRACAGSRTPTGYGNDSTFRPGGGPGGPGAPPPGYPPGGPGCNPSPSAPPGTGTGGGGFWTGLGVGGLLGTLFGRAGRPRYGYGYNQGYGYGMNQGYNPGFQRPRFGGGFGGGGFGSGGGGAGAMPRAASAAASQAKTAPGGAQALDWDAEMRSYLTCTQTVTELEQQGSFTPALLAARRCAQEHPRTPPAFYNLAHARKQSMAFDVLNNMALAYASTNELQFAAAMYEQSLRAPNASAAWEQVLTVAKVEELLPLGLWAAEQNHTSEAMTFFQRVFEGEASSKMRRVAAASLLELLNAGSEPEQKLQRDRILSQALTMGLFQHPQQRPAFLYSQPVLTQAWHEPPAAHERLARELRALAPALVQDVKALQPIDAHLTVRDGEGLAVTGQWDQLVMMRNGHINHQVLSRLSQSGATLFRLLYQYSRDMPKGSCEISFLAQGSALRVANESRAWANGELLLFDDSFEHEVWNNASQPRVILIFDVWHPDLEELQFEERRERRSIWALGRGDAMNMSAKAARSRLVLLGTGPSTCVPNIGCLLGLRGERSPCAVCKEAHTNPISRNKRTNPSMLLQYKAAEADEYTNILFDCGKTFRSQVERFFPKFEVKGLDAILLTHDHADAVLGLDDLRDLQRYVVVKNEETQESTWQVEEPMQVFCSDQTFNRLGQAFPYLVTGESSPRITTGDKSNEDVEAAATAGAASPSEVVDAPSQTGEASTQADPGPVKAGTKEPKRHISQLKWNVVADLDEESKTEDAAFNVHGLEVKPLRLHHGGTYLALGFLFGAHGTRVAYLSDTNGLPARTMRKHTTHFSLPQSLELIRELRPKQTYLVGMSHEFNYHKHNAQLAKLAEAEGLNVAMGYDGLHLDDLAL